MRAINIGKKTIRNLFEKFGLEISRQSLIPRKTLLGLASKPIATVLDIGANKGQFLSETAELLPSAHYYCFEPLPDACSSLKATIQQHKLENRVEVLQVALGKTNENTIMYLHQQHNASSSLLAGTETLKKLYPQTNQQTQLEVQVCALDSLVDKGRVNITGLTLVKIDVQGYEDRVLSGGSHTLGRASACLIEMNLESLYQGQPTFDALYSRLTSQGFVYRGNVSQSCKPNGEVVFLDALFAKEELYES